MSKHTSARTLALVAPIALAVVFFMNGGTAASWFPHVGGAKAALGLDEAQMGFVLMAMPIGLLSAGLFVPRVIARFGTRGVLVASMAAYAGGIGLAGYWSATSPWLVGVALFIAGAANIGLDIAMTALVGALETRTGKTLNSYFQAAFSVGQLLSAFIASRTIMAGGDAWPHLGVVALVGLALAFTAPLALPSRREPRARMGRPDGRLLVLAAVGIAVLMVEGTVADWSSVFVREELGRPELAGWAYTGFALMMVLGRLVSPRLVDRFGVRGVVAVGGLVVAAGTLLVVTAPSAPQGLAGFTLVGLGAAGIFPTVMSATGDRPTDITLVTTVCYAGFFVGPPLIGFVAHGTSIRVALGLMAVLALAIMVLSSAMRRAVRWTLGPAMMHLVLSWAHSPGPWAGVRWSEVGTLAARALTSGAEVPGQPELRVLGHETRKLHVVVRPGDGDRRDELVSAGPTRLKAIAAAGAGKESWKLERPMPEAREIARVCNLLAGEPGADEERGGRD